jgi:hypothetical protein
MISMTRPIIVGRKHDIALPVGCEYAEATSTGRVLVAVRSEGVAADGGNGALPQTSPAKSTSAAPDAMRPPWKAQVGPRDRSLVAEFFRCGPRPISRMTDFRRGVIAGGLIATMRSPHQCRRGNRGHKAHELTQGPRLRSWTEGWRLGPSVCGSHFGDVERSAVPDRVNRTSGFAERVRPQARQGETLPDRTLGRRESVRVELMRLLLLPPD